MKYDFASYLLRNSRDVIVKTSDDDAAPWSGLAALKDAVLADTPHNADTKLARYEVYLKLRTHTVDTEYSVEEVAILKKAALAMPTVFAGQLSRLLDQKVT